MAFNVEETTVVIKEFIKTYLKNSGLNKIVVGISGGIDSAVTAILVSESIGRKNVRFIFLPDDTTPKKDIQHIDLLSEKFNFKIERKNITKIIDMISNNCILKPDLYAIANIKARTRMIILFEYANMNNALVCGTSNKSEILVGYFTKYGDGGVDIMPIGDLYKTQVYDIARFLKIPEEIINKKPTAGLIKDQCDEYELKICYEKLDKILMGLEKKMNIEKISKFADVQKSEIERIKKMRILSQHKRRTPMIPKIGIRTVGLDWRNPNQLG